MSSCAKTKISVLSGLLVFVVLLALGGETYAKAKPKPMDQDKDGLTNQEERDLGTNPRDPDSDDDGLSDGLEVKSLKTNPKDADSDDDNLKDGDEVVGDSNPHDSDSDDDGIDDGDDDDYDSIEAHKFQASFLPLDVITFREGEVEIKSEKSGGRVKLEIIGVRDVEGNLVSNTGNTLL